EPSSTPFEDDTISPNWITSNEELAAAAGRWGQVLGLDTEFQRTSTFYPLPGLYQVVSEGEIYLIDPLLVDDWTPLVSVLEDADRTLVMHACGEDLELLSHHLGATPRGLFDTQLANAFLSPDFSLSYSNLVARHLDVTLGKPQTRSDWRRRPLSEAQVRYACEDVLHLLELHQQLRQSLESAGRYEWFEETMRTHGRYATSDPDQYYLGFRKAWRFGGQQLAALKRLAAWRERTAMLENVPRNRVIRDEHLLTFAERRSLDERTVREVLPQPVARRYGSALVAEHQAARDAQAPSPIEPPLSQQQGEVSKQLRDVARAEAERRDMAQELLARRRDIERCIRHFEATGELSREYLGWREPLLGEPFRRILTRLGSEPPAERAG
ncbi:MAG TPA: HRDC domain-containing protein, partial [Pseudomonadales bacterium]